MDILEKKGTWRQISGYNGSSPVFFMQQIIKQSAKETTQFKELKEKHNSPRTDDMT